MAGSSYLVTPMSESTDTDEMDEEHTTTDAYPDEMVDNDDGEGVDELLDQTDEQPTTDEYTGEVQDETKAAADPKEVLGATDDTELGGVPLGELFDEHVADADPEEVLDELFGPEDTERDTDHAENVPHPDTPDDVHITHQTSDESDGLEAGVPAPDDETGAEPTNYNDGSYLLVDRDTGEIRDESATAKSAFNTRRGTPGVDIVHEDDYDVYCEQNDAIVTDPEDEHDTNAERLADDDDVLFAITKEDNEHAGMADLFVGFLVGMALAYGLVKVGEAIATAYTAVRNRLNR